MTGISWKAIRAGEKLAEAENIHISQAIKPDGGDIMPVAREDIFSLIKKRPLNSHKGVFGRLVIIAGSDRFPGAAQIATIAALRSGVGLVRVFSTEKACMALSISAKEATLFPCPADDNCFMVADNRVTNGLRDALSSASAVLIGCGLGATENTLKILETVIENAICPIIIDANGINLVSGRIELLRKAKKEVILTPHPAELSRLAGKTIPETIENRYECARQIHEQTGATVVSKSCATVVVSGEGCHLLTFGNDGLAKGGSGDLQAGLTASFAAQGLSPASSGILGSGILGIGCEEVSRRLSKTGMLAGDILYYLPRLFKKYERA